MLSVIIVVSCKKETAVSGIIQTNNSVSTVKNEAGEKDIRLLIQLAFPAIKRRIISHLLNGTISKK